MPVTPFHFGAGLLAKGLLPRSVSFLAFVVAQVVIDLETAYFMLTREWPFHRWAHTLAVGSLIGLVAGFATSIAATLVVRRQGAAWQVPDLREAALLPAFVGGSLGGLSHALLDAIMHDDMRPLRPFSEANPFLAVLPLPALHGVLLLAGIGGIVLLALAPQRLGLPRHGSRK